MAETELGGGEALAGSPDHAGEQQGLGGAPLDPAQAHAAGQDGNGFVGMHEHNGTGLEGSAGGAVDDAAAAAHAAAAALPTPPADALPPPPAAADPAAPRKRRHVWGPPAAGEFPTLEELQKPKKKKKSRWESAEDERSLALVPVKGSSTGALIIPGQMPREVTLSGGTKVGGAAWVGLGFGVQKKARAHAQLLLLHRRKCRSTRTPCQPTRARTTPTPADHPGGRVGGRRQP